MNLQNSCLSRLSLTLCAIFFFLQLQAQSSRTNQSFDRDWSFKLGDTTSGEWRTLNLPHDWSIEGKFSEKNPASPDGGALPGGTGWYKKRFVLPESARKQMTYINFDGIYQKSDVWLNGHHLGYRPNGYISFRYLLTPFLNYGARQNELLVKVDNSSQPNSRWYSGSGIYRHVRLERTALLAVDQWGTVVTAEHISDTSASLRIIVRIRKSHAGPAAFKLRFDVFDPAGKCVSQYTADKAGVVDSLSSFDQSVEIKKPALWSIAHPNLYTVRTRIIQGARVVDDYSTSTGIRSFKFDANRGFILNGQVVKILGVCDHHDLGSLGSAVNYRALERQLQILKNMGCNGIRTSHNPPAPELLDLCDKMGFVVMDEAFDCWEWQKTKYDYHLFFKTWHRRDLTDQVLRDRNHPSVVMWSIGNEIPEQTDSIALRIAPELATIVHSLDTTRPLTAANNDPGKNNRIISSGAIDVIGYNYHEQDYPAFHERYPGKPFIGTETTSAIETRGFYQMPSDSIMRWPTLRDYKTQAKMNANHTVSSYDNVSVPWGSTHEETWKIIRKHDFLSGIFIWTGFDYLGEPTPYGWPSKSSYFGIIDMAGFPKDVYYMYQSEMTDKTVLHLFPHWNWKKGQQIDEWVYYNHADEVELFLNGKSLGVKRKGPDDLHVMWRLNFEPGTLRAVSRLKGKVVKIEEIHTAGEAYQLKISADRASIHAGGDDLSFLTVQVLDRAGHEVPDADPLIEFEVPGQGFIAGLDNGNAVSHESFRGRQRKAFHGKALLIIGSAGKPGIIKVYARAKGLKEAFCQVFAK